MVNTNYTAKKITKKLTARQ